MADDLATVAANALVDELQELIEGSRARVAQSVNGELVLLYWRMGSRLREEVVGAARAAYGEQIVETVAQALSAQFGRGFGKQGLYRMMQFAEVFPDPRIVAALRQQLTWTHLRTLIAIDDPLRRQFYTELCRVERWSTRALKAKMDGMLYERTAIAKRPKEVVAQALDARSSRST